MRGMAIEVGIDNIRTDVTAAAPSTLRISDRERRLLVTARRRRLARMRRNAETAAWIVGSLALAVIAFAGLAGLR